MSRRTLNHAICAIVVAAILFAVVKTVRDVEDRNWLGYARSEAKALSRCVDAYRDSHGEFPATLNDLSQLPGLGTNEIFSSDRFKKQGTLFIYTPKTNGYNLAAIKQKPWYFLRNQVVFHHASIE